MTPLRPALNDYLAVRRALGYKLLRTEKLLQQFIAYLDAAGAPHITIDLAMAWATLPAQGDVSWWAGRLTVARGFATYLGMLDPETEVPPTGLLPARSHRAVPYLYGDKDIAALMSAAHILSSALRVLAYQTLIGLLAVTGMRVGEAIRLNRTDLDLDHGVLTIHLTKFGKSRQLPLHSSTLDALVSYLQRRDELHPHPNAPSLFISPAGTRLLYLPENLRKFGLEQARALEGISTRIDKSSRNRADPSGQLTPLASLSLFKLNGIRRQRHSTRIA